MIKSFKSHSGECEDIFHGLHTHQIRKMLPSHLVKKTERRLDMLNAAPDLQTLTLIPSMKGEAAVRDAHGTYSIPIEDNWRIAFRWETDGPAEVEIKGGLYVA